MKSSTTHLRFQAALFIQPLTLEQVHHYLASADLELAALNTSLQADTTLQELAKSPLMLSIMTLAYQGMSVTDLPGMNLEERRQHLLITTFNACLTAEVPITSIQNHNQCSG
jgi:hypothetical protein